MRYAFAGDRLISLRVLRLLMAQGFKPCALLVVDPIEASHAQELIAAVGLDDDHIIVGKDFQNPKNINLLDSLDLDYIFGIHFPYIIPKVVLQLPSVGFLNLHPAYLPYNKGWHTPSWAILDGTPYGATLHFMVEELDAGDIIEQALLEPNPEDTAHSLYQKCLQLEYDVFEKSLPEILSLKPKRQKQRSRGTTHTKKDLKQLQEIHLDETVNTEKFINRLKALTTNNLNEAPYFVKDGKRISIQISLKSEE